MEDSNKSRTFKDFQGSIRTFKVLKNDLGLIRTFKDFQGPVRTMALLHPFKPTTLRILIRVPVRLFVRLDFIQTGTLICYLSYFCHFCHEKSYPFASVRRKKNLDLQFDRSRLFLLSALNNVCVPLFW